MSTASEDVLQRLEDILNRKVDSSEAHECFSADLLIHFGGLSLRGIDNWFVWFRLIERFSRVSELAIDFEKLLPEEDRVEVLARWRGARRGKRVESDQASATYRFEQGKIVEIWTKPENYSFLFGRAMLLRPLGVGLLVLGGAYVQLEDRLRPLPSP